jgi:hypothetical protein
MSLVVHGPSSIVFAVELSWALFMLRLALLFWKEEIKIEETKGPEMQKRLCRKGHYRRPWKPSNNSAINANAQNLNKRSLAKRETSQSQLTTAPQTEKSA